MGCGASQTRPAEIYYPSTDMRLHAARMDHVESGKRCPEPSPMMSKLRLKYQTLKSRANLCVDNVEFEPDARSVVNSEHDQDIGDWLEEAEIDSTDCPAAPLAPVPEAMLSPGVQRLLEAQLAESDERHDNFAPSITLTRESLKRHNKLCPLGRDDATVTSYTRSKYSMRFMRGGLSRSGVLSSQGLSSVSPSSRGSGDQIVSLSNVCTFMSDDEVLDSSLGPLRVGKQVLTPGQQQALLKPTESFEIPACHD